MGLLPGWPCHDPQSSTAAWRLLMCGRYAMFGPVSVPREAKRELELLDVDLEAALNQREPQYNIAPTQHAPVLAASPEGCQVKAVQWGLVPSWAKDIKIGAQMINARAETVASKPAFRGAFKKRRCLVPASGYFEWKGEPGHKQPYFIHAPDGALLMFAGLWEAWRAKETDDWLRTFTIVTGEPGRVSADIHDRQPVILPAADWSDWLTADAEVAQGLLEHVTEAALTYYPVTKAVGSPRNKGAELVEPISL